MRSSSSSSSRDVVMGAGLPAPLPPSTNGINATLRRLSLNAASATALPSSPQVASPQRMTGQHNYSYSPSGKFPPLPRSPSAMSLDRRSSTPGLHRKASMNSLHGVGGITPPRPSPSRRSSSAQPVGSMIGKSPLSGIENALEAPQAPTAASIASAHFRKELDLHEDAESRLADTIVILHDACYGHRYSRPRTSRASLSTIVERPERIQAGVLGLSMAYVRLGGRHAEGRYPIQPKKRVSELPNIPFRIRKTTRRLALSSPAVTNVHGTKWMEELKIMCDDAEVKLAMNGKELMRPEMNRSPDQGPPPKLHEGDLYLCSESLNAIEGALGAVCEGVDAVFQGTASGKGPRRAFVAIRPPGHHCSADYPSGFCWLNNVHVGISHAALHHGLTHVAIVDFDLHHGDGSQSIAWDHNTRSLNLPKNAVPWKKTSIGYFSLHDINSYPCEMGDSEKIKNASLCIDNAHGQSMWNIHLQPWRSEAEFWELYETRYTIILEKARKYLQHQTQRLRSLPNQVQPKGAIFLSAGFDASEWESSGMQRHKVNVPTEFYARLTRDVVKLAAEEGCSVQGRIISVLEGGYSDRALCSGILSHISGLAGGDPSPINTKLDHTGLGYEIAQKSGALCTKKTDAAETALDIQPSYDSTWWALPQLEAIDVIANPPPVSEAKKPRDSAPPTYSSPTQSFKAKIATPKPQRSASSSFNGTSSCSVSRAPSPPPPEVYWTTAVHELSKLLIPSDRQTISCKPEDLSAEATRMRRDRQSTLTAPTQTDGPAPSNPSSRMALRERKAKPLSTPEEEDENERPISRASRRRTLAGGAIINGDKTGARGPVSKPDHGYKHPTKQSSRRLSLVSNAGSVISVAPSIQMSNGHTHMSARGTAANPMRPGSPHSVRPDSSLSTRSHSIPPMIVKKTRSVNPARTESSKASRANRKFPPAVNGNATLGTDGARDSVPTSRVPSTSKTAGSVPSKDADIDALTNGMKKIKITLVTKAQREAGEEEKLASKPAPATTPKKATTTSQDPSNSKELQHHPIPSIPTLTTEFPSNSNPDSEMEPPSQAQRVPTPQKLPPSRFAHLQDASNVPLPFSLPPAPVIQQNSSAPASTSNGTNVFIPYQPEGPAPAPVLQQEPLKWLPPNVSTPTLMKRGDLPVFTSTGPIPFKSIPSDVEVTEMANATEQSTKQEKLEKSIWDVPETPGR